MTDRVCFVIAPIGEADSETRKRSDQVLKHVIAPAVLALGYRAVRADQISEPGMITSQVIQHIVDDPLVVADLTERNPNVFYELAIRHAIRKPLVQLIRKGDAIPFDVAGTRTIHVDHRDLDSVDAARDEIQAQVRSLEVDASKLETPISVALDLQVLRASSNPEQRSMGDVLTAVTELRQAFGGLEEQLRKSDPSRYLRLMNDRLEAQNENMNRREAENEHMRIRLASASLELKQVSNQVASVLDGWWGARDPHDYSEEERNKWIEAQAKIQKLIAVLPEPL